MEWLGNFLTSGNFIPAAILIIVLAAIAVRLIKKGYFSFKGKSLRLGIEEDTRQIIRNQMDYVETACNGMATKLPPDLNLDIYRTKYIICKVIDCFQSMILYNHITTDERYIKAKQEIVYFTVLKRTENPWFQTPEFKEFCDKFVEDTIKQLVFFKNNPTDKVN